VLSTNSLDSLKGFCCKKNRMVLNQLVLDESSSRNRCHDPLFIGDTQYKALLLLHDLYYLHNQSRVEPKSLIYAGIAKNRKVAWVYLKRLRKLCVLDENNNIDIERVEKLLRLSIRMISYGIRRSRSLCRKGSRRCK